MTRSVLKSSARRRAATTLLAAGLTGLAALPLAAHAAGAAGTPVKGGDLTWGVESEPNTLNPQLNGQAKAKLILRASYESLFARQADGAYVPWLATAYEISPDGKRYTFTLRDNVKFTDGRAFDAAAVATNFEQIRHATYCSSSTACEFGARIQSVEAVDARTVRIQLTEAYTPFLPFAAALELLSPAAYDAPSLKSGGPELAGTGPFILKRYQKGQNVEFVRNPDYNWAPATAAHQGPAWLDRVTYRFLPESAVRTGALLSGQVDVIEGISGNDARLFKGQPDYQYLKGYNAGTPYSLYLNVTYGPTRDVRVRRALLEGLDVDAVIASVYRGERTRAWGIASPVDPYYTAELERAYGNKPQLANQLLDDAGWSQRDAQGYRTQDGERLSIDIVQSQATVRDQRDVLLLALQAQARQRLGVDFKLRYVDIGTYATVRKTGEFGSIPNSRTDTDGLNIGYHYLPVDQGGAINYSRTAAPELRGWLAAGARSLDNAERRRQYGALQKFAVADQALAVPLYIPEDQIAAGRHVQGLGFRSLAQLPENAYDVWIKRP
ncbi:peptide/nickel transport system substrate-binding protein [Comamonas sp. BIGb0124]|uniref:ABC transporter substrate-binding protein n=1 Tax=Comamonas sp. BIGb0124 TaxID=2485130 RepID=UPI000F47DA32|nr:ABC transporter substrate-binding protein [Comamonas sp. BIGb0124]ROR18546.1 peptide/nickel transport system substrate-binding protein [Comamonas sp. BIGb0124]